LDELRRQCQALAQEINQEKQLGLTSQQIATLVEVIWPHLNDVRLTRTGELRKKDVVRLRSWLGDCYQCYQMVVKTSQEQEWGLAPEQLTALASAALPHVRAILRARPRSFPRARLRNLIVHYYSDSGLVEPLLALVDQGPGPPPENWGSYLKRVSMVEYGLTSQQAGVFVSAVWRHILRCLHRYHYTSRFLTWLYHMVDNYQKDGETWVQVQQVSQPVMENLLIDCLADRERGGSQRAKRLQTLGHKAGLPPEALGAMQYVADCAGRLFAQDPARLALQACADISAGLPSFCFGSRLTTWIYQVILNSRKKILQELDRDPIPLPIHQDEEGNQVEWEPLAPGPGPDEEAANQELVEQIRGAIHRACQGMHDRPIPRWKKEWIGKLRFVQGEEHKTISEITGVNVNTVMTIVARIKPHLIDTPWLADYLPVLTTAVDRLDRDWQKVLAPGRPARLGEALNYRVTLANTGQADANEVTAEVALPSGTQVAEGSLATHPPEAAPARHNQADGAIHWQGELKAGQQVDIIYTLHLVSQRSPAEPLVQGVQVRLGRQGVATTEMTTPLALK
jgi:uncharacterized repeat protein (TIGR01451 family)